jgi:hypothetical protein
LALVPAVSRICVPSDLYLTPTVLIAALRKVPRQNIIAALRQVPQCDIEEVVDVLITELDCRAGDADCEAEPDEDTDC